MYIDIELWEVSFLGLNESTYEINLSPFYSDYETRKLAHTAHVLLQMKNEEAYMRFKS